ncbi:MAG: sugar phosphate isomerase/epimerase [Clostridia bacterium]|nr:sugar phosphate isomerase/epimerase [Clostridia bacterium]
MKLVMLTEQIARRVGDKKAIEMIKTAGFDGYDYTMAEYNYDLLFNNEKYLEYAKEIRRFADDLGISCLQAHAPSPRMRTLEQVIPCVPIFLKAIEISAILGCKILVVHPGAFLTAEENKTHLYDKLLPYAIEKGVIIATENMFKWKDETEKETVPAACGTALDFIEHIDLMNNGNFTACLDVGHAEMVNCEGAAYMIRQLGHNRVGALHIHDNDLYDDLHTLPFVGKIDWEEVMQALKDINYQGCFTYENTAFFKAFPDELLLDCLRFSEKVGRFLINL